MNIYRHLGAKLTTPGDPFVEPCVYGDGSVSEQTKFWALHKLGYIDCEAYHFKGWSEAGDKSNVSPFSVTTSTATYCLRAVGGPGEFEIAIGSIDNQRVYIGRYHVAEMPTAIKAAEWAASELFKRLPDSATQKPHSDDRYEWDRGESAWKYRGSLVDFVDWNIAGFGTYRYPRAKGC
jgi:hypothetical protein